MSGDHRNFDGIFWRDETPVSGPYEALILRDKAHQDLMASTK
jgi:hypothetical protein